MREVEGFVQRWHCSWWRGVFIVLVVLSDGVMGSAIHGWMGRVRWAADRLLIG